MYSFRRIIKHYFTIALQQGWIEVDSDTYAELDGALDDLKEYINSRIETEVQAAIVRHESEAQ